MWIPHTTASPSSGMRIAAAWRGVNPCVHAYTCAYMHVMKDATCHSICMHTVHRLRYRTRGHNTVESTMTCSTRTNAPREKNTQTTRLADVSQLEWPLKNFFMWICRLVAVER